MQIISLVSVALREAFLVHLFVTAAQFLPFRHVCIEQMSGGRIAHLQGVRIDKAKWDYLILERMI